MRFEMNVPMKRGGKMPMVVEGDVYNDSDGSGRKWAEVEIEGVFFIGAKNGKRKDMSHIVDIEKLRDEFYETAESHQQGVEEDALLARAEARAERDW